MDFKKTVNNLIKDIFSREMLRYMLIGLGTFIIDITTFEYAYDLLKINPVLHTTVSHIISWVFSTTFAFFLNKYFVFHSKKTTVKHFLYELGVFFGGRLFSLVMSIVMLLLFINILDWTPILAKLLVNVFVVVFNYIIAKLFIFKRKEEIKKQVDSVDSPEKTEQKDL